MRVIALTVAALLIPTCAGVAASPSNEPFDFKGVKLGITIAEFQALPIPEDYNASVIANFDAQAGVKSAPLPPRVSCEPLAAITSCEWQVDLLGSYRQEATPIATGNGSATFEFVDAPDGQKRLARIAIWSIVRWAGDFRAAYEAKYGQAVAANGSVQNGLGATFNQTSLVWSNAASDIMMTSPCQNIDRFCITYTDKALALVIDAAKGKAASDAAKNL